ncbi:uncharacterized protein EV422DRAFT_299366 [Fimicolochytrium jonesii]|uniref:uncharacterized protein n=1 Tax=Fimicolochytrium jonesii TaxID=1396493 RepID=UPI0022FEC9C0|nr:uncharacterized protein EV422DRAFT_299366 [Fimicolochytrium jonesii]KAI8816232.1 hypothetical protein EV422DRAFT_299366 [Fimicolochytrium jonesii]
MADISPFEVRKGFYVQEVVDYMFGVFLAMGALNVWTNLSATLRRPDRVYILGTIAAVLQWADKLLLAIGNSAQVSYPVCSFLTELGSSCYYIFQIISTGILIYRGTTALSHQRRLAAQIVLSALLTVSIVTNAVSAVRKEMFVGADGICVAIFDKTWNNVAKSILLVLYILLLFCFVVPVLEHLQKAKRSGLSAKRLQQVLLSMAGKIFLVILAFTITIALSLAGYFGTYWSIEFMLEDYFTILASTWSVGPDTSSDSSSTGSNSAQRNTVMNGTRGISSNMAASNVNILKTSRTAASTQQQRAGKSTQQIDGV